MPKREPTPPLEDDFKYYIINYPFPLHANMAIPSESHDLAHWIASCIGQNNLTAIYHKPSAPNMVIIEVIKHCPRIDALLGAHRWCEFLKRPEADQVDKESRVYYCRHSSGREVQKHGWKRLDVWDHWFDSFDPVKGPFVSNPYPKASFCEVPPETQTDYGLCRPLPTDVFPRSKPTAKRAVVPGSEVYVNSKKDGAQPIVVAPILSNQPARSWASVTSSDASRKTVVKSPRATLSASSEGSSSVTSPIDTNIAFSPPPGLGSPPGLSFNDNSEWEFKPSPDLMTTSSSADWASSTEIITAGLAAAAIEDQQNPYNYADEKDGEQYWAEQPARPRDWDKAICPVHKVACRSGICEVMDEIERKKRQAQKAGGGSGNDDDGWVQAKTRGRGRGRGQGRGRGGNAHGNGTKRGGRARGGWC